MIKRIATLLIAVLTVPLASASELAVANFDTSVLRIEGSQCDFSDKGGTVLVGDWVSKFWMKIDGKMIEFQSHKNDAEIESQLKSKRWRETLKTDGVSIYIDLVETGRGDDSAAFRGYVDVSRNGIHKHLAVVGGCGA